MNYHLLYSRERMRNLPVKEYQIYAICEASHDGDGMLVSVGRLLRIVQITDLTYAHAPTEPSERFLEDNVVVATCDERNVPILLYGPLGVSANADRVIPEPDLLHQEALEDVTDWSGDKQFIMFTVFKELLESLNLDVPMIFDGADAEPYFKSRETGGRE